MIKRNNEAIVICLIFLFVCLFSLNKWALSKKSAPMEYFCFVLISELDPLLWSRQFHKVHSHKHKILVCRKVNICKPIHKSMNLMKDFFLGLLEKGENERRKVDNEWMEWEKRDYGGRKRKKGRKVIREGKREDN